VEWTVTGIVSARSAVADPQAVPYADQVMAVHLVNLQGDAPVQGGQALVYLLAMRNKTLTDAAGLAVGAPVRLKLRNWNDVAGQFGRISRSELDDPALLAEEPCWGEVLPSGP
jgi:alginate O-acetyltransferase complex protein AlgJ